MLATLGPNRGMRLETDDDMLISITAASALRSARLPVNLIGSPVNYANRLIGSPINSQSTDGVARRRRPSTTTMRRTRMTNAGHDNDYVPSNPVRRLAPDLAR
jgi:hypothetical protein